MRKGLYLAIVLSIAVQVFGCAGFQAAKEEKTARGLAEEGMEAFRDKDYEKAIESFEKLRDWYPFSRYAILPSSNLAIPTTFPRSKRKPSLPMKNSKTFIPGMRPSRTLFIK